MKHLIAFFLRNSLLLNLLTLIVLIAGGIAAVETHREAFPSVDFDTISITTLYPGASPKEVEIDVTQKIEDEIETITGLDEYSSQSYENLSLIIIKLDPELSENHKNQKINQIQRAVDRVQLPQGVSETPKVTQLDSGVMPVLELTISGNMPYHTLHKMADDLIEKIKDLPDANSPVAYGFLDQEYWVEVEPKKLERFHIGLGEVIGAISSKNINLPGGVLRSKNGDYLVRTIGEVDDAREIDNIVIRTNLSGKKIFVKDIGQTRKTFSEADTYYRTNGSPSINLIIRKKVSGDIIHLVNDVKKLAKEYQSSHGDDDVHISFVNDMSVFVKNRLGVLVNNGLMGMVFVLLSLLVFLSRGIAIVAALGMPIALLGAILVMNLLGMTINLLTLFALVIVLGMLVDDAIIVAENIWHHYESGKTPLEAAVEGTREVFWPVCATILTTISAFFPLLLVYGIFGKFIESLPKVVIISLVISLIEAMFILPSHAFEMLRLDHFFKTRVRKKSTAKAESNKLYKRIISTYEHVLRTFLNHRYISSFMMLMVLVFAAWIQKNHLKTILFPSDDVEFFFIRVNFSPGTSAKVTEDKLIPFEQLVQKSLPASELKDYVTYVGLQQVDGLDPLRSSASHLGQVAVYLKPSSERQRKADEIIAGIRDDVIKLGEVEGASKIVFTKQRLGPPVGKPVAVRIYGKDFKDLRAASHEVQNILQETPHVSDISSDDIAGKDELQIKIDQQKAAQSLLKTEVIANHVRASLEGQIASHLLDNTQRIPVRVRYSQKVRNNMDELKTSLVMNSVGQLVPMNKLASFELGPGVSTIKHRFGSRVITVSANLDESRTSSHEVNRLLSEPLRTLKKKFPHLKIEQGGEYEDTAKSMESLQYSFGFALAMIFVILATIFRSLTQPLVVMAAIPFAVIGVILAFYCHNLPLSFLALIGVIGLSGVVVNDSIVLVDFINQARIKGMGLFESVVYASKRRFRAVWLTSITTIFGLLPIAYGIGGEDPFLKPAAMAIGYGLIFATVLILLFVPALYLVRIDMFNFMIQCLKPLAKKCHIELNRIE